MDKKSLKTKKKKRAKRKPLDKERFKRIYIESESEIYLTQLEKEFNINHGSLCRVAREDNWKQLREIYWKTERTNTNSYNNIDVNDSLTDTEKNLSLQDNHLSEESKKIINKIQKYNSDNATMLELHASAIYLKYKENRVIGLNEKTGEKEIVGTKLSPKEIRDMVIAGKIVMEMQKQLEEKYKTAVGITEKETVRIEITKEIKELLQ